LCRWCICCFDVCSRWRRLRLRSREFKELEIVCSATRLRFFVDRLLVLVSRTPTVSSWLLPAGLCGERVGSRYFIRPDTLLGRHRRLARKRWTYRAGDACEAPGT